MRKKLIIIACCLTFVCANTFIVGKMFNAYEVNEYPPQKKYDVGILLGGFSGLNKRNNQISFSWANDRLLQAVKLLQAGQIKKLIISSGNANFFTKKVKEADLLKNYLTKIGIADSLIIVENQSRNTVENVSNSFEIIKKLSANQQVLVITSAWHIPRAKSVFEKRFKSKVFFYPTNFIGKDEYQLSDYFIPNPSALTDLEFLIKECVGLVVERVRN